MTKRLFDVLMALGGLVCLSPLLLVVAILVKLSSPGPVVFRQVRVGRGFRHFHIYKFRSMVQDAPARGASVTAGGDPRVTRVGKFLRRTKIDELLQLINVLKGDMSLVGPRPEVPKYVKLFQPDFAEILTVRPGVTDLASVKYRDEEAYLGLFGNPEEEYIRSLLPEKIELARQYVRRSSFLFDIGLILRTVWSLGFPGPSQVSLTAHNSPDVFAKGRRTAGNFAADANHKSSEREQIR
jgi:lipopolysaccharide/colanic/teichoic acid biosynthesis glycosyltransferase